MNILLDTCTFLWVITGDSRLSPKVRESFVAPEHRVTLSAVSAWEIAIKHRLGKLPLPAPPEDFIPEQRIAHGIDALPLEESAALMVTKLPDHHRDPFDRMLICQAIVEGATIATPDPEIIKYPVATLW